ncbi:hypothetical protein BJ742DRAFT_794884 [Cladochytrium replicatum]|nr:hypothetical protein BJ742DRAFT_794884 [Cladochytrium replicatum]
MDREKIEIDIDASAKNGRESTAVKFTTRSGKLVEFTPSAEEKEVVGRANWAFLRSYSIGLSVGFAGAFMLMRQPRIRAIKSYQRWFLAGGVMLTGEIVGRKVGVGHAKSVLQSLPLDSKLRELLETVANTQFRIPPAERNPFDDPSPQPDETENDIQRQPPPSLAQTSSAKSAFPTRPTRPTPTATSAAPPSSNVSSDELYDDPYAAAAAPSWDKDPSGNGDVHEGKGETSAWDRLRAQAQQEGR